MLPLVVPQDTKDHQKWRGKMPTAAENLKGIAGPSHLPKNTNQCQAAMTQRDHSNKPLSLSCTHTNTTYIG